MNTVAWLFIIGIIAGLGFWLWRWKQAWTERQRAAEERYSSLLVTAHVPPGTPPGTPAAAVQPRPDAAGAAIQKLLFDAAAKAGEAGEPVLSIQLYAKLLSRYPACAMAAQVRAAVEVQKKKLAKPQNSA
jgi:hypothetical protein